MLTETIAALAAVALVVVLLLITRLTRRRETTLQENTQFVESLWDDLPLPAFLLNANGVVCRLNAAAERLFNVRNEALQGRTLADLLESATLADSTRRDAQTLTRALSLGGVADGFGKSADGERFPIQLRTRRVTYNGDVWLVGTAHDTSDEHRVKDALRRHLRQLSITKDALQRQNVDLEAVVAEQTARLVEAKDTAEKANASKSVFLANVSHELRTPLHAILSFARFGVRRFESAERGKLLTYFERIESSGTTLLSLLNGLLDLSKLEAGAVELNRTLLNVASVVADVGDELSGIAHEKSIRLSVSANTKNPMAVVDGEKLSQVIRNLLGNAFKFTPAGGSVSLTVDQDEDSLIINIRDSGPGIPDDECEAVFSKFVQASTNQGGSGGTGLGLTISREIVKLHGGILAALPTRGQGAHLQIRIPIASENETTPESAEPAQASVPDPCLLGEHALVT